MRPGEGRQPAAAAEVVDRALQGLREVGYLPGVTDNEGRTAKEAVERKLTATV